MKRLRQYISPPLDERNNEHVLKWLHFGQLCLYPHVPEAGSDITLRRNLGLPGIQEADDLAGNDLWFPKCWGSPDLCGPCQGPELAMVVAT